MLGEVDLLVANVPGRHERARADASAHGCGVPRGTARATTSTGGMFVVPNPPGSGQRKPPMKLAIGPSVTSTSSRTRVARREPMISTTTAPTSSTTTSRPNSNEDHPERQPRRRPRFVGRTHSWVPGSSSSGPRREGESVAVSARRPNRRHRATRVGRQRRHGPGRARSSAPRSGSGSATRPAGLSRPPEVSPSPRDSSRDSRGATCFSSCCC